VTGPTDPEKSACFSWKSPSGTLSVVQILYENRLAYPWTHHDIPKRIALKQTQKPRQTICSNIQPPMRRCNPGINVWRTRELCPLKHGRIRSIHESTGKRSLGIPSSITHKPA